MQRLLALAVLLVASPAAADRSDPAFLGVGISDLTAAGPCSIQSVTKGSGAHAAGLRIGDELVAIAGKSVMNCDAVLAEILTHEPGSRVKIEVNRGPRTKTITASLYSRAEVMRQRFVGQVLPLMTLFRVDTRAASDLATRGETTIVGWFDPRCVGCDRVFAKIARWVRDNSTRATPIVALAATQGPPGSSIPDALKQLEVQQRRFDVPLLVAEPDTYREVSIADSHRITFMVIDQRGIVQYAVPLKPDADDTRAVLQELYAAAELAARRR